MENTCDIKHIFKHVLIRLFCSGPLYFFLLLNYQNIKTKKNIAVCVVKSFKRMYICMSRIMCPIHFVLCRMEVELNEPGELI